mgnify:FL=1
MVDVGVDRGADLEDGHSLLRTVDERVEDSNLDLLSVPELAPRSHTWTLARIGYTLTAVPSIDLVRARRRDRSATERLPPV